MDAGTPTEKLEYLRPPDPPGVEIVKADATSRLWRVFHTTYTVCTILDAGHGLTEWTYRSKTHHSRVGDLMLMEPGELHAGKKLVGTACRTFRVLNIEPSHISGAAKELGIRSNAHFRAASVSNPAIFHIQRNKRDANLNKLFWVIITQTKKSGEQREFPLWQPGEVKKEKQMAQFPPNVQGAGNGTIRLETRWVAADMTLVISAFRTIATGAGWGDVVDYVDLVQ